MGGAHRLVGRGCSLALFISADCTAQCSRWLRVGRLAQASSWTDVHCMATTTTTTTTLNVQSGLRHSSLPGRTRQWHRIPRKTSGNSSIQPPAMRRRSRFRRMLSCHSFLLVGPRGNSWRGGMRDCWLTRIVNTGARGRCPSSPLPPFITSSRPP